MVSAGTIFTNDRFPRATTSDLRRLRPSEPDEHTLPTLVREGATIGAGSVIGNDLVIGRFAMIGMGSLVTKSIPGFSPGSWSPGNLCRVCVPLWSGVAGSQNKIHMGSTLFLPPACQLKYSIQGERLRGLTPHPVNAWTNPSAHSGSLQSRTLGIVGGGMLGMTLAHRLAQQGKRVTLFEAASHLGGLAAHGFGRNCLGSTLPYYFALRPPVADFAEWWDWSET